MTIDLKRALSSGNSGDSVAAGLGIGDSKLLAGNSQLIVGSNGEILISRMSNRVIDRKLAPNYFKAGLRNLQDVSYQLTDTSSNNVNLTALDTFGKFRCFRMPDNWSFNTVNGSTYPLLMDLPNGGMATIFYRSQSETDDDYHWVTSTNNRTWTVGELIFDGDHNGPGERPIALYSFLNRNYLLVRSHNSNTLIAHRSADLNSAPTQYTTLTGLVGETWGCSVDVGYAGHYGGVSAEEVVAVNNGVVLGIMSRTPAKVIYRSTNGTSFTAVSLPSGDPECLRFLDNKFVVTTSTGRCYYSTDLENWLLAFNLNDGSLVDTTFSLLDGYWVFNRRAPSANFLLPAAGSEINQSITFNVCYVTNSLDNPSISRNKSITINATQLSANTTTSQTTLSAINGFNSGNWGSLGVFRTGSGGFSVVRLGSGQSGSWFSQPTVSKNSDVVNWLLSDSVVFPVVDLYESAVEGSNVNSIKLSTKSGKIVHFHPNISQISSVLRYRDPTMPDVEETITLPALDRRYFRHSFDTTNNVGGAHYDSQSFLEFFDKQVYTRIN